MEKSYKHFIVLALCCGLAASSIGISINSSGVFYTPVSDSLHIMRGAFSMHMTIFSLATALGALLCPKLIEKIDYKKLLFMSVVIAVISTGAMAFCHTLIGFYVLGAIRGLSTSMFSIVPLTMIINHWFVKKHGFATSLVFGFSGLSGTILSPLLSMCIQNYGWQMGYIIKAGIILVLCLPAVIYPFKMNPQDEGLKAYGYEERKTEQTVSQKSVSFINVTFICFFTFSLLVSCLTSFTQHFPGYGESLGYSASISSFMLSAGMAGNIISKLFIGTLSDRYGSVRATVIMLVCICLGIGLLMVGSYSYELLLGAFLFGASYSVGAVGLPLLTKTIFGLEQYTAIFPKISFASNIGAALSLSFVGYIYDFFGSYIYAFIIAIVMLVVCVGLLFITIKKGNSHSATNRV